MSGMGVAEALIRLKEAEKITGDQDRWRAYDRILDAVHSRGYSDGVDETSQYLND